MSRYWIADESQRVLGPMSLEVVRDLLFAGKLRGAMQLSRDGAAWASITTFPELTDLLSPRAEQDARDQERKEAVRLQAQLKDWATRPAHEIFRLPEDSSPEQMRAAFFRLVKRFYPDRLAPETAVELRDVYQQVFQLFSRLMVSIETRASHPRAMPWVDAVPVETTRPGPVAPSPPVTERRRSEPRSYDSSEFVGLERRGRDRVMAIVRVTAESARMFTEHTTVNLSSGGVFIAGSRAFPLGTMVDLEFRLEDPPRSIKALGKVVWENSRDDKKHPRGFGVRFTAMSESDRFLLCEQVGKLQAGRAR